MAHLRMLSKPSLRPNLPLKRSSFVTKQSYLLYFPPKFLESNFERQVQWVSSILRGAYLDISCDIEFMLVDMTCVCLIKDPNDRERTKLTLMSSVGMRKIISISAMALNKYNCTYYEKYKDCFDKFRQLLAWRNKFAHSRIKGDAAQLNLEYVIFEYIENGKMVQKKEEWQPLISILKEYGNVVHKIVKELIPILYAEQHYAYLESKGKSNDPANTPSSI